VVVVVGWEVAPATALGNAFESSVDVTWPSQWNAGGWFVVVVVALVNVFELELALALEGWPVVMNAVTSAMKVLVSLKMWTPVGTSSPPSIALAVAVAMTPWTVRFGELI